MLKKYINVKVEVAEKYYDGCSTMEGKLNNGYLNKTIGIITDVDDTFVELDNKILISINHIYRIKKVD